MKKIIGKICLFLESILGIFMALILVICLIFRLPADYIKYKHSLYYRKERKKYHFLAGMGIRFDLYNEILKNALPIRFIYQPNSDSLDCGWFVFEKTLIIPDVCSFVYDEESEKWNYCADLIEDDDMEKQEIMPLENYIQNQMQEANELAGRNICDNVVFLMDANCLDNADQAKKKSAFLIYDSNRVEALKSFCNLNL